MPHELEAPAHDRHHLGRLPRASERCALVATALAGIVLAEREGAAFSPEGILSVQLDGEPWLETAWDVIRELE